MNPVRKKKMIKLGLMLLVVAVVCALVLYALRQNISLFYTPTQIAMGQAPIKKTIRIGGMVEQGSIKRTPKSLKVQFDITDYDKTVTVIYTGILPDLFREGQGIVAEGQAIDTHNFQASQVLAKHDANYMPPEVKAALAKKVNS